MAVRKPPWPGSGPSEAAIKRRLRRSLGREPSRQEIRAGTLAASTFMAREMLRRARPAGPP